jgi:hypothetical protein
VGVRFTSNAFYITFSGYKNTHQASPTIGL